MAKKQSRAMTVSRPVVVAVPAPRRAPGRFRRAARSVGRGAKRGSLALARTAFEEKFGLAAIGGAAIGGYLEASGNLEFLPDLGIGRPGTAALGMYIAGRVMKSQKLRLAALGLGAVAAWDAGQQFAKRK